MPRRIETLFVAGPAGRLEAILEEPEDRDPVEAALVCHPHPQHGGTMHNKVVYRVARGLRKAGAVVLRFNYRGVNLSEGAYDNGEGEIEDARAALRVLRERYPGLPVTLAGFSFGSRIALKLAASGEAARRVIPVGFPTIYPERGYLNQVHVPRYFIQSTNDEFGPIDELGALVNSLPGERQMIALDATDHYFAGALPQLEEAVAALR
jgi:alpha/beta superfamily hydrolase